MLLQSLDALVDYSWGLDYVTLPAPRKAFAATTAQDSNIPPRCLAGQSHDSRISTRKLHKARLFKDASIQAKDVLAVVVCLGWLLVFFDVLQSPSSLSLLKQQETYRSKSFNMLALHARNNKHEIHWRDIAAPLISTLHIFDKQIDANRCWINK